MQSLARTQDEREKKDKMKKGGREKEKNKRRLVGVPQ